MHHGRHFLLQPIAFNTGYVGYHGYHAIGREGNHNFHKRAHTRAGGNIFTRLILPLVFGLILVFLLAWGVLSLLV